MAKNKVNGICVTAYQKWLAAEDLDAGFVAVKATNGTGYINPWFETQIESVILSKKIPGLYHYANGCGVDEEVNFFLQTVRGYIGKAVLCLYWNTTTTYAGRNRQYEDPGYAKRFMDEVKKRTGVTMMLYAAKADSVIDGCMKDIMDAGYPVFGAEDMTATELKAYVKAGKIKSVVKASKGKLDKANLLETVAKVMSGDVTEPDDDVDNAVRFVRTADTATLAVAALAGKAGSGGLRKRILCDRYNEVMHAANTKLYGMKGLTAVARDVLAGKYGNDPQWTNQLRAEGYDTAEVQKEIDRLLGFAS